MSEQERRGSLSILLEDDPVTVARIFTALQRFRVTMHRIDGRRSSEGLFSLDVTLDPTPQFELIAQRIEALVNVRRVTGTISDQPAPSL